MANTSAATATAAAPQIQGSIFEGLFLKGVGNDPALHEKLRAVGFDAKRMEASYPSQVFEACLMTTSEHLWPGLDPAEGLRRLGKATTEGYRGTLAGSIVLAAARMLGPVRLIKQLPNRFKTGTDSVKVEVQEVGPRHWRLSQASDVAGISHNPEFVAGAVEASLELTGVRPKVTVASRTAYAYALDLRWEE